MRRSFGAVAGQEVRAEPPPAPRDNPAAFKRQAEDLAQMYGAAQAEADRALLPAGDAAVKIVGRSSFGPIFTGFEGRWKETVAHLRAIETGEALGVLSHPDVPAPIDAVWGEALLGKRDGYGLKIVVKHLEVPDDLPERLAGMRIQSRSPNRIRLVDGDNHAVIGLDYLGEDRTWLLTAYEKGRRAEGVMESLDGRQAAFTCSTPLPAEPTQTRQAQPSSASRPTCSTRRRSRAPTAAWT